MESIINPDLVQVLRCEANYYEMHQILGYMQAPKSPTSFTEKETFPIGAIIGSVIGVVVILCGIIALIWWFKPFSTSKNRRRYRNGVITNPLSI